MQNIWGVRCRFFESEASDRFCGRFVDDAWFGEGGERGGGGEDGLVKVAVEEDSAVRETDGKV